MKSVETKLSPADQARVDTLAQKIQEKRRELAQITARTLGYKGKPVSYTSGPAGTHSHDETKVTPDEHNVVGHVVCARFQSGFCVCYNITTNSLSLC